TEKADALRDQHLRVPAANGRDVRVAVIVDVLHDDADLVDVPRDHDRRTAVTIHTGHAVAVHVAAHLREWCGLVPPHLRWCGLETRGTGRVEQTLQKRDRTLSEHGRIGGLNGSGRDGSP